MQAVQAAVILLALDHGGMVMDTILEPMDISAVVAVVELVTKQALDRPLAELEAGALDIMAMFGQAELH